MDILIVDDNEDYLMLMKDLLYANGYSVITATDGLIGCEILGLKHVDLIISDIKMPKLDGIKLHAFARELDEHRDTKFIFITGYKDVFEDVLALDPSKDFLLDKTTPAMEVIAKVNELMFGKFISSNQSSAEQG